MHIRLDRERDQATIYLGEYERQAYEQGSTYLVLTEPVEVQLGFEGEHRLLFVKVRPASEALAPELLAQAETN